MIDNNTVEKNVVEKNTTGSSANQLGCGVEQFSPVNNDGLIII